MRRFMIVMLGIALVSALVPNALAGKPTKNKFSGSSANAFWYTTEWLDEDTFRQTTWYVGVSQSTEGNFSDLYYAIDLCNVVEEPPFPEPREPGVEGEYFECANEEYEIGFKDLTASEFSSDARRLAWAHIDAVYDLQSYDENGEPAGDPEPTRIVADWDGIGSLARDRGIGAYTDGCNVFRYSFRGKNRAAEATGTVDGVDLGETYDAYLSAYMSSDFSRAC